MEHEIWKPIVGYEGYYEVSNLGRVCSIAHYQGKWGKVYRRKSRHILKESTDKDGYKAVTLFKNGNVKRQLVHRLVAISFIPNPHAYSQVNHKDEIKSNNRVDNLEWCDSSYNQRYGTLPKRRSSSIRNQKSISKQIVAVFGNGEQIIYPSMNEAERQLNISWKRIRKSAVFNSKVTGTEITFKYL